MKNEVKTSTFTLPLIAAMTITLASCMPDVGSPKKSRASADALSGVAIYQGKILADNPIILSKNVNLSDTYNLNGLLSTAQITTNSFLTGNTSCIGLDYCFEVRDSKDSASPLQTGTGKWAYNASSTEFLQVNTFYHLNSVMDMFLKNLTLSYDRAYFGSTPFYETSLPKSIQSTSNHNLFTLLTQPLTAYSNCNAADAAYFEPTTQTLCLGYISGFTNVKWAQDSSVIYHEAGHFFQKLQLNLRNSVVGPRVDMGNYSYDEAGAIGEGISDYYSYFVNGRTHFAEWGAGRFLNAGRPISENDSLHVAGLSTDPDQRLSYPQFIGYNPNNPSIPVEDIHYSGMIVSHYLVALTEDLQSKCALSKRDSSNLVLHLISETLAEHGDLNANGTQGVTSNNKINLNTTYSSSWFKLVNPITYRSFMQTFAKNLKNNLSSSSLARCNGGVYTKDQIESLIDQYGLLLFRTYNENRNLSTTAGLYTNTAINSTNRKKSVLVSKNLLILDPTANASSAYIIDDRTQIKNAVSTLQAGLLIGNLSSQTPSDFGFNNNNGKMSPGEIVAVGLNLYNNSNTTMGGIQVLANDWNHADSTGKPYRFPTEMSEDQWPLVSEGAVDFPCTTSPCRTTAASATADFAPICFVQYNEASSTKWISQKDFQSKVALDDSFCLDPTKPNECFIRAIKGADQAHYSKINPKSTWGQTMANPNSGKAPSLDSGNVILFEVSKHIPPGTVVDCRLRVRFTNCEDCYHDASRSNYDYKDTDYNGPLPFKTIHLQIPIVD